MFKSLKIALTGAALLAAGMAATAQAETAAEFFKGKQLRLIYGFGVGGTYGKYSTMLADFMPKHIPGNPTIIAQSMPGAGGLNATNFAYAKLPQDGTGLFMPPDSLVISQLLRPEKARYDSPKFTWLGTVIQSNSVVVLRSDAGIKKLTDAQAKQIIMASTGKGSQTFLVPQMVNGVLNTKFKIVMGYKGSAGSTHAMELGEAQGVSLTWLAWKTGKPQWFQNGFATPIVQNGFEREKDLPDVPMLVDLVDDPDDKKIVRFMATLSPIGRGIALPPGVPADRVAVLKKAFWDTVSDPEFQAAAEQRSLRVNPLTGEQVQKIVGDSMDISPAVVDRARKMIMGDG